MGRWRGQIGADLFWPAGGFREERASEGGGETPRPVIATGRHVTWAPLV